MKGLLPQVVRSSADFDSTLRYRYRLVRDFEVFPSKPCVWIMLNPSTASSIDDDPTVRRCQLYSLAWGFDSCRIVNIFALRSTNPKALYVAEDPVGPENDRWLLQEARRSARIVCAWGNHGRYQSRGAAVYTALDDAGHDLWFLGMTKQAQPVHPLYQRSDVVPLKFASIYRG